MADNSDGNYEIIVPRNKFKKMKRKIDDDAGKLYPNIWIGKYVGSGIPFSYVKFIDWDMKNIPIMRRNYVTRILFEIKLIRNPVYEQELPFDVEIIKSLSNKREGSDDYKLFVKDIKEFRRKRHFTTIMNMERHLRSGFKDGEANQEKKALGLELDMARMFQRTTNNLFPCFEDRNTQDEKTYAEIMNLKFSAEGRIMDDNGRDIKDDKVYDADGNYEFTADRENHIVIDTRIIRPLNLSPADRTLVHSYLLRGRAKNYLVGNLLIIPRNEESVKLDSGKRKIFDNATLEIRDEWEKMAKATKLEDIKPESEVIRDGKKQVQGLSDRSSVFTVSSGQTFRRAPAENSQTEAI